MAMSRVVSIISLCVVSSTAFSATPAPSTYKITLIDSAYGYSRFYPTAIDNKGMVVGTANYCCGSGPSSAFSWTEVGGRVVDPNYHAIYTSVSNKGTIAGTMGGSNVLFWPTVKTISGQYYQYYKYPDVGKAVGVNDFGFATGNSGSVYGLWNYNNNSWTPLTFTSTAINNGNLIVGYSKTSPVTAMIYDPSKGERSIGSLGATSAANDINDAGVVVGSSGSTTGSCANGCGFAYSPVDGIKALPKLATGSAEAKSVNISGDIVGVSLNASNQRRAVLWNNGTVIDLNSRISAASGWVLMDAVGINDNGQIVGHGTYNGESQIFLLTPSIPASYSIQYMNQTDASGWRYAFRAVNNSGKVVGETTKGYDYKGFDWTSAQGYYTYGYGTAMNAVSNLGYFGAKDYYPTIYTPARSKIQYTKNGPGNICDVNDTGFAIGWVGYQDRRFLWQFGTSTEVNLPFNDGFCPNVNNNNVAVGNFNGLAYTYDAGVALAGKSVDKISVGHLGSGRSQALDINDSGLVVGHSSGFGFTYTPASGIKALPRLSTLSATATGVNNAGLVVGNSYSADNRSKAVVWDGANVVDLNTRIPATPGLILSSADDISDNGLIIGYGTHNGVAINFVLTPE